MISRRKVLSTTWDLWQTKRGGRQTLLSRQQNRLQTIIEYARTHSPFYHKLYQHLPSQINQLTDLSPVTKRDLMAHFDEWVTDPQVKFDDISAYIADTARIGLPYLGRYAVWRTSGTTGSPGVFLHDEDAIATYYALLLMRGYLAWFTQARDYSPLVGRHWRAAFVYATGGHFAGITFATIDHHFRHGFSTPAPVFSAHIPLPELVRTLNDNQPTILSTYPSILAILAGEQASGRLSIKPLLISTGGECLTSSMREQAGEVFQCRVYDTYSASEFMGIAFDCNYGRLHVNLDCVILEPVDADYRPLESGNSPHTVLLTNLVNRIQPIIRYEMGDRVSFCSDPCLCGSPLPAVVVAGRDDEILSFEADTGKYVDISPLPLETIMMVVPGVQRFQLIQTGDKVLKVRLEAAPGADPMEVWQNAFDQLHKYLSSQGLSSISLERSAERPIQDQVSAKFRHVWSEWRHSQPHIELVR